MHMTIRRTLLFVLCVFSFSVHAASNAKLQLNGMASYWSGPSEVYIAALLVEQPSQKADTLLNSKQAKRMDIRITTKQWRERNIEKEWRTAIAQNNPASVNSQYAEDLEAFLTMFKGPLVEGDRMTIDYTPESAVVNINGVELLSFANAEFFTVLLRTWLGPQLPYASFREQILGSDVAASVDLQRRFRSVNSTVSRRAEIEQWLDAGVSTLDSAEASVAKNLYRVDVTRSILRRVVYPSRALRAREEGTSVVKIRLDDKGSLQGHEVYESSGSKSLDAAAMQAIVSARFSSFPAAISDEELEFLVPVRFVLP